MINNLSYLSQASALAFNTLHNVQNGIKSEILVKFDAMGLILRGGGRGISVLLNGLKAPPDIIFNNYAASLSFLGSALTK